MNLLKRCESRDLVRNRQGGDKKREPAGGRREWKRKTCLLKEEGC